MERLYGWALRAIIALIVVATVVAFGESFVGLHQWAQGHGVGAFWDMVWPLMIDTVVLVGEAALFVGHYKHWRVQDRAWSWLVTFIALAVSVAANTGHVNSSDWLSHLTAALPPIALMFCMTVGFGVMKRVHENKPDLVINASRALSETEISALREKFNQDLTERSHTASENVSDTETLDETPAESDTVSESETPDPRLSETMIGLGFKATEKSFTMPRDAREGLSLVEKRVRDMYDVDPEISVNSIATNLGISWATAKKHLDATKEARGLSS